MRHAHATLMSDEWDGSIRMQCHIMVGVLCCLLLIAYSYTRALTVGSERGGIVFMYRDVLLASSPPQQSHKCSSMT